MVRPAGGLQSPPSFRLSGFFRPFTEQRGADADKGGSLFDGHLKVAAHPHAECGQRRPEDLLATLLELACFAEERTDLFGGWLPWRNRHQAMDFEAGQGVELGQLCQQPVWR